MDQSKVKEYLSKNQKIYVSITGLKVKSIWKIILFLRHAMASKKQVDRSPGILFSAVKRINGIEHTLTAWENQECMRKFIYSGAHKHAIKAFRKIATGKTFGYESNQLPSWEEVHDLWNKNGKEY